MDNIFEMYKTLLTEYINRFGMLELICNFVVALGLVLIYLRVYSNFKDAGNQKSFEKKKVKSIVETFSMTAFFAICGILVLFRIGSIESNIYIDFFKVVAILVYIFGVFVNLYGRKCLGTNWGNNVVIYSDHKLIDTGLISKMPIVGFLAATSVGVVNGQELLDLCYVEDSAAGVDMNVIMSDKGEFIEIQATGEKASFSKKQLDVLLNLAELGIEKLIKIQKDVLK